MAAILVVEDDRNQRILIQEELELDGHACFTAAGGKEALAAVNRAMPDVVVLDIGMPGMDGLDVLGKIMDINNRLPVIIYTAYSSYQDNFMAWAADAYVVKSSDLSKLKRAVRSVLASRDIPLPRPLASPPPPETSARR